MPRQEALIDFNYYVVLDELFTQGTAKAKCCQNEMRAGQESETEMAKRCEQAAG